MRKTTPKTADTIRQPKALQLNDGQTATGCEEEPSKDAVKEAYRKADEIWEGARRSRDNFSAGYWLSIQLQLLTSTDKNDRDRAKTEIRKLVKLGKGE